MPWRFPGSTDRVSISGATGSGKTRFGVWLYSMSSEFSKRPHVIIDFKGDDLIARIDRAERVNLGFVPKHPGLYIVDRPRPDEHEKVDGFLWKIWDRGNCGLFIDEGYMISPTSKPYNAILTQGRSLRIPTMTLTQRPVSCSRFVFSEANFYAVFRLNDLRDFDVVTSFCPKNEVFDAGVTLPEYTARWYDVSRNWSALVEPVPNDDAILARFDEALRLKHRSI